MLSRLLLNSLPQYNMHFRNPLCRKFSFMETQNINYLIRILQASLEGTIFLKKRNLICVMLFLFYRKPCIIQQNIVNFKHMFSVMNYLSFISLDMIEALFFLAAYFVTPVRLMNNELYHFIRIVRIKRRCFPWGLPLGIYH